MFQKILIANRGEIALRIIRACKELGIKTVAVHSQIDEDSLHVHMADEAICIGPAISSKSYLNIKNIISAAIITKAEAIHPGYGFLSESIQLAKMCKEYGIKLIGPREEHIKRMGDKAEARKTMIQAGVPVVPGSKDATNDPYKALEVAKEIGFPVMIKAVSGGGGRGMRLVYDEKDFINFFNMAKSESKAAFDDDSMYIEKYIEEPRHIEFQILADEHKNVVHLGERDCSLQRRNQKVLEEAPCSLIDDSLRKEMGDMAIKAAKAVEYVSAGTIEFLLDKHKNYYFIEMNTRIQVEHPITEYITGIDLIKEQIKIADGEKLTFTQEDIKINGHAIECRINAEDTNNNFAPSPGVITDYFIPGGNGIRMDSHIYSGYKIPSTYDSMIGKLIVWGKDRQEAICRMKRALDETVILGIHTNIDFQRKILNHEKFLKNEIDTSFIGKEMMK
ncbi:acetyl-CoA carboxylase biotin carboxylase subunit [Inediibacterium massiliense]|uniref:acetyl-CoA carboxylase biotin carboxylase subunit n=1 Tax=Inediibacterium massiliense TaxID=1658111 RepID=UPI0006B476E5|nr:acetyl-CoA carboxylase biotin carboxylase subunit [Inediibacterium massiliense]